MESEFQITVEEKLPKPNENLYCSPDHNTSYENSEGLMRTSSLTSLDFFIKGERMVSELCNISAEFTVNDTNISHDTFSRRGFAVERRPNTAPQNISQQHKASQTVNNSDQLEHNTLKYGFEKYDETIPLQIIHLAVEACSVAENIAIANKYRPCFKNIQTICEKTRSNVQQPDSAVAQLHSQGVPWVMKNFIFAFVRILDGWKGIKELMCEKHESFVRIEQKYYNPQIQQCFVEWQYVTKKMLDHIYRTFKSLDEGFRAEQQAFKNNLNYSLQNQNRIKLQPKSQMKTSQYYESPNPWKSIYGQNVSNETPLAAKWSTNPAIANTLLSVKPSFGGLDCSGEYLLHSKSNLCENKDVIIENDPKVINGMGDSSKAVFNQQIRSELSNYKHISNLHHKAMCSSDFGAPSSMTSSNEIRMLNSNPSVSPGPDNIMVCNQNHRTVRLGNSVNYQSHRSCLNESTIQEQLQSVNHFNSENILSNNFSWPNTGHNCNVHTSHDIMEPSCCLQSKCNAGAVYMKPGRYNVPIKLTETTSSFSNQEHATVETMVILNSDIGTVQSLPMSATESTISSSKDAYIDNIPSYNFDLKYSEIETLCTIDEKWEAAKGSVPELINNMNIPEQSTAYDFHRKIRPINNIKVRKTPLLLFSGEYSKNSNTVDDNNDTYSNIESSLFKREYENKIPLKQLTILEKNQIIAMGKQNSILEKDSAHGDIVKKFKKKNKLPTVRQFGKKKKEFDAIKRMEYILDSILVMEQSLGINTDVDIHQASHYHFVIKDAITFDQVSDKINNSSYYNIDILENDIRKKYTDAITYLEAYPESMLKLKIEKLSQYFEDLITKDDLPDVENSSKDNNIYYVKSIMKKPDLNPAKKISFACESKTLLN